MSTKELTKEEWFRAMFHCPNCMTEKFNYKCCPFHEEGKKYIAGGTA